MPRPLLFVGLAVLVGAVLAATVFRNDIASARPAAQAVTVDNTAANPVPVRPPLWQGTPYMDSEVVLDGGCEDMQAIPAGKVLFLQRAVGDFNVVPGGTGSMALAFTPLGGTNATFIDIPNHASAPALQVAGKYDGYSGVVEVGQPTTATPEACMFASSADIIRGKITIMGYLLPAS
jgi:hypothetical protein